MKWPWLALVALLSVAAKPKTAGLADSLFLAIEEGRGIQSLIALDDEGRATAAAQLRSARSESGATLLTHAVLFERLKDAKLLTRALPSLINERDREKHTPLFHAVSQGQTSMVKLLLSAGAQLDQKFENGETILFEALRSGDAEIFRLILKRQPQLADQADDRGQTPLVAAVDNAQFALGRELILKYQVNTQVKHADGRSLKEMLDGQTVPSAAQLKQLL